MIIESREIPQANTLSSVVQAITNIGNGARTDEEIIQNIPNIGSDRQGRYYRLIGELLGLVNNVQNNATLTETGVNVFTNPTIQNPYLINGILNMKIFQIVLPIIELRGGVTHQDLVDYLVELEIPLSYSTIDRRVSSLLAWLRELNIVIKETNIFRIQNMISPLTNTFQVNDNIPILPASATLQEYQTVEERVSSANEIITSYRESARMDRAINAHRDLVNLVAERIRLAGGVPKSNQFIDLATTIDRDFIFEMKSTTTGNVISQVRKGISQLYEYRYLENKPDASLVLVVENPLANGESWILDYMETDRNIHLVWDGNDNLYGSQNTRDQLGFLGLLP